MLSCCLHGFFVAKLRQHAESSVIYHDIHCCQFSSRTALSMSLTNEYFPHDMTGMSMLEFTLRTNRTAVHSLTLSDPGLRFPVPDGLAGHIPGVQPLPRVGDNLM